VALNDILFIESLKDYIKVVTTAKTIVTKQLISSIEEMLPNFFLRIHRSFIVALNKIESQTTEIIEIARQELPVSRRYCHEAGKTLNSGRKE